MKWFFVSANFPISEAIQPVWIPACFPGEFPPIKELRAELALNDDQ